MYFTQQGRCADDVTKLLAAMLEDLRNQNGD